LIGLGLSFIIKKSKIRFMMCLDRNDFEDTKCEKFAKKKWLIARKIVFLINCPLKTINMALKEKLEKLKSLNDKNTLPDWFNYKEIWKKAVLDLQHTIMEKWFNDYQEKGLMNFDLIPTKRLEPYIGEYQTSILEITLVENKYLVLEPIAAVTAEYDGKLEFYMRGNISKKVSILRKILNDKKHEWIIAKSYESKDHYKLDKEQLEKLIEEWLQ